ncbi:hypothetical protein I307_05325 [Cryptococcus deuterogattii 99/473]|uniref:Vps72/YL1 C-terminal domain-containing protein n=1 Tax=Cryptococcus deuterogattii Ram5 TaxID=1296110 RepID=A0A0D0V0B5_9TREE|nr:hypothetical protein I313_02857 [Cryptococcus deuterogattii Ram5]KIY55308.1 hypothetical protein I307_05325 [Cryptococcus deuterogattii 99/473]
MPEYETITQGRARRSTAGNRMRELLEKAHQEDEDELFKEVEDDEEFVAPPEQKDIFLDEFADTDSAPSDEDEEAQVLRAERRAKRDAQAKGKSKSKVNPLTAPKYGYSYGAKAKEQGFKLKKSDLALLGEDVDVASMAPSTLVLELRRRKREAKRVNRSEARRSNLRASTLATAAAATDPDAAQGEADAEEDDGKNKGRRGRVAQHIAATRTIRKPLTQSQLIEAALEEEERNKEALRDWLKKEEEKRELRRVGRKVVKGPRWTWVSRTVGRLVEEVPEPAEAEKGQESELNGEGKQEESRGEAEKLQGEAEKSQGESSPKAPAPRSEEEPKVIPAPPSAEKAAAENTTTPLSPPPPPEQQQQQPTETQTQPPPPAAAAAAQSETNAPYTRNYIILSQIPGGLPAELQVVLGSHVEWDKLKVIPSRNRPINRPIPLCPFTNLPAKYRHPTTLIPFATKDGYQEIEALLLNRYEWVEEGGWWGAGEGDVWADGMEAVAGLDSRGAGIGGWYAGERLGPPESQQVKEEEMEVVEESEAGEEAGIGIGIKETTPTDGKMEEEAETGTRKRARQSEGEAEGRKKAVKSKRRR